MVRTVLRWVLLAVGLSFAGWLLRDFWWNLQNWRATRENDPSVAELYSDGCLIDGGMAIGVLLQPGQGFIFWVCVP